MFSFFLCEMIAHLIAHFSMQSEMKKAIKLQVPLFLLWQVPGFF
jgi:hypothetical protein